MKKIIIVCILIINATIMAQPRVDRITPVNEKIITLMKSELLTNSMGWAYNEWNGEWSGYPNVICKIKGKKSK